MWVSFFNKLQPWIHSVDFHSMHAIQSHFIIQLIPSRQQSLMSLARFPLQICAKLKAVFRNVNKTRLRNDCLFIATCYVTKKKKTFSSPCVKSLQKAWWCMLSILGGLFPSQQLHSVSSLLIKGNTDVGAVLESQTFLCSSSYSLQARSHFSFFFFLSLVLFFEGRLWHLLPAFAITKRTLIGPSSLRPAENNSDCPFSRLQNWNLGDPAALHGYYHDHLVLANQAVCFKKKEKKSWGLLSLSIWIGVFRRQQDFRSTVLFALPMANMWQWRRQSCLNDF